MTDFPSLKDELRPKPKLRRHEDPPITDEEIEANSRQLGQRWGASTSIDPPGPQEQRVEALRRAVNVDSHRGMPAPGIAASARMRSKRGPRASRGTGRRPRSTVAPR